MKKLSMEEVKQGMLVSVYEWKPREVDNIFSFLYDGDGFNRGGQATKTIIDNSFKGNVMRIVRVDYPYCILKYIGFGIQKIKFDLREVTLCAIDKKYAKELLGEKWAEFKKDTTGCVKNHNEPNLG